jgi:hypothetical protein
VTSPGCQVSIPRSSSRLGVERGSDPCAAAFGSRRQKPELDPNLNPRGVIRGFYPCSPRQRRSENTPMTLVFDRLVWRVVFAAIRSHGAQRIAVLACVACACVPVPAFAAVAPRNGAATRAYLRIAADQVRVAGSDLGMGVAAVQALEDQVAGECPGALAFAPRDVAFEEIGDEVEYVLSITFDDPLDPQALGQARVIGALSWSNRRLTRLVRDQAAEERAYATHVPPNLCAQIAAWRESAYAAVPASSSRFLAEMRAGEPEVSVGPREQSRGNVIARLLERYERPAERRLAKHLLDLENRVADRLNAVTNGAERQLAATLGVATL